MKWPPAVRAAIAVPTATRAYVQVFFLTVVLRAHRANYEQSHSASLPRFYSAEDERDLNRGQASIEKVEG
jgi:hypothetical protein